MKPKHQHDCDACIFLGSVKSEDAKTVDLYLHMDEVHDGDCTFIARYSSYGPDYSSGGQFCWSSPHLNKALRLAHEQGLLKGDVLINLKGEQARWLKYCQEDPQYKERIDERFQEERFLLP